MLSYCELTFEGKVSDPEQLPDFTGIAFRGALGLLLKRAVCQVSHEDCSRCLLLTACPYPAIFEGVPPKDRTIMRKYPRIPQPFVVDVSAPSEVKTQSQLDVTFRLFGAAARYWPYICHTIITAGQKGIGRKRVVIDWQKIRSGNTGQVLWQKDDDRWDEPLMRTLDSCRSNDAASAADDIRLEWHFVTPLSLPTLRPVEKPEQLGLALVLAGRRRWNILNHFYGDGPESVQERFEQSEFRTLECKMRPWAARRFSGRQQRSMKISGLLGRAVIEGPWLRTGSWLDAAPIIHLGKKTSFGFGRVNWIRT